MIEGIGSIVRYMGKNWINGCVETPAVFGVRKRYGSRKFFMQ